MPNLETTCELCGAVVTQPKNGGFRKYCPNCAKKCWYQRQMLLLEKKEAR